MESLYGIDVGVGSIKLVSIVKEKDKLVLQDLAEAETPDVDWLRSKDKNNSMAAVSKIIKSLVAEAKLKTKKVVTCLPEDEVVSRLIRLPPIKENEIKDALKFEAETFVPFPLSQASIDYEIIEKDDMGRMSVFTIAAKNETIQSFVKLFKMTGLELVAIESPATALRRVMASAVSTTVTMLVADLGEKFSDIIGISDNKVYFTRAVPVGGESLTRAISVNLGLDMASAEQYKKAYGLNEMELEGKIKSAIIPVFSSMAEEIRRALGSFREELNKSVGLLVLSGGGANLPGFAEELARLLGVEVQVVQPFINLDVSRVTPVVNMTSEGCRFSLAVGLALRGLA